MPRWPSLIVGMVLAVYWLRVMKMAVKARRHNPRGGAHVIPPEPLGRVLRVIWFPTIGLWIAVPLLDAFIPRRHGILHPLYQSSWLLWPATLVAGLAFILTLICWRNMGKSWRMGIDPAETIPLVVNGPWAYVRHPIYALSSLLMLATLATVPTALMAVVAAVHLSLLQWEAAREEQYLIHTHGDVYRQYRQQTGRFIPIRLRPYRAAPDLARA